MEYLVCAEPLSHTGLSTAAETLVLLSQLSFVSFEKLLGLVS